MFPFLEISFLECVTSWNPKGSTDKPIPSSVSRSDDDVQRETNRQRVKRHMRAHTVAEPSDIEQKVHRIVFDSDARTL